MMSSRSNRRVIAQRTLDILERGHYTAPNGAAVQMHFDIKEAIKQSKFYGLDAYDKVFSLRDEKLANIKNTTEFEVFNETTLSAASRLAQSDDLNPLCLNFASAKNPGGGFLGGSEAQEESLARSTGIYPTLTKWPEHYAYHRKNLNTLYSDRMIYSPNVPVFLDDDSNLLDEHYLTSFVTSPAVNLGALKRNQPSDVQEINEVMLERMNKLLAIAVANGHNSLILGAWGCGVFRNDPSNIASLFGQHLLAGGKYHNVFKKVVFAVLDNTKDSHVVGAFEQQFNQ